MKIPKIYTAYDTPVDAGLSFKLPDGSDEPTLTVQDQRDECDINHIIARFEKTGVLPVRSGYENAQYLDVTELPDYQTARQTVIQAEQAFMQLDAHLRAQFNNNPAEFIDFMQNPDNVQKAIDLGLATPRQAKTETGVSLAAPTDATASA